MAPSSVTEHTEFHELLNIANQLKEVNERTHPRRIVSINRTGKPVKNDK